MSDQTCKCGRPAEVHIEVDEYAIVSNEIPFGQDVCLACHFKHRQFRAKELIEWLDYFKPRVGLFPFETELPPPVVWEKVTRREKYIKVLSRVRGGSYKYVRIYQSGCKNFSLDRFAVLE